MTRGEKNIIQDAMGSGYGTAKEVHLKSQVHTFPKATVTFIRKSLLSGGLELPPHNTQSCARHTEKGTHSSLYSPPLTLALFFLKLPILLLSMRAGQEKTLHVPWEFWTPACLNLDNAGSKFL